MGWQYRVVIRDLKEYGMGYSISEYYPELRAITGACDPFGETLEELRTNLEHMLVALDKPPLRWEDFVKEEKK